MVEDGPPDGMDRVPRGRVLELQAGALGDAMRTLGDRSRFYRDRLRGRSRAVAADPSALGTLPLTSRGDLVAAQAREPPWGGLLCVPIQQCSLLGFTNAIAAGLPDYAEVNLATTAADMRSRVEAARRGLAAGGSGPGDRTALVTEVARSILHHAFLGALVELGSTPFQTGRGLTLRHVRHTLPALEPTQLLTHPTYARHLAKLLEQEGRSLPHVERLFLWGEVGPSVPRVREGIERAWGGARVRDVYAAEELGVLAAECQEGALHGLEDHFVYEVVDPLSDGAVGQGGRGELVVTTLRAEAMPLVRYRTGDLVSMEGGACGCGRTHVRIKVHGRIVRGPKGPVAVDLEAVEDIIAGTPQLDGNYRVVVGTSGPVLEASIAGGADGVEALRMVAAGLEERGLGYGQRIVEGLPRFYHRSARVVRETDLGLWRALAEEQRRLEE